MWSGVVVVKVAVAQAANDKAEPDHSVHDDHERRENGVAGQGGLPWTAGEHHRDNQRHFDDGDGHRQHERAEGFAHPVSHHLRMVDGGQHCADEEETTRYRQRDADGNCYRRDKQSQCCQRKDERPAVHGSGTPGPVCLPAVAMEDKLASSTG